MVDLVKRNQGPTIYRIMEPGETALLATKETLAAPVKASSGTARRRPSARKSAPQQAS